MTLKSLLLVALGGGFGSAVRFAFSVWINRFTTGSFPLATFAINLAGCIAMGFLSAFLFRKVGVDDNLKLLLLTGVCGGFTTFSAFAFENFGLIKSGNYSIAIFYSAASLVLGIAGIFAGIWIARVSLS